MRSHRFTLSALISVAVLVASNSDARPADLTDVKFKELHQQLRPGKDEPWLTIPWRISLLDAQNVAAKEGKPIFIWAMDGHPLGCT
jgi:hypothetical protein